MNFYRLLFTLGVAFVFLTQPVRAEEQSADQKEFTETLAKAEKGDAEAQGNLSY
ncbi:MAG: hypothetical protein JWM68_1426, partial [Verrucomicrobiales bacterium]|nr:hypothetical protein [Verrucomicrobiales bacterium]